MKSCVEGAEFRLERMASTLGRSGAREQTGSVAAAAEVLLAAVAGLARLLHPIFSAEFLECGGVFPNLTQAAVFHVFKGQAGNVLRGVAWERIAAWGDEHQLEAPAAHAGLGIFCVVIRDDVLDANSALKAFLFAL